ncbi:MAG: adenylyl-sulfate kinase [Gemmatimonadota bacterium]
MEQRKSDNVVWQPNPVRREEREERRGHRGAVLWFTGLSASGKSTIAMEVEQRLFREGYFTYVLDGDNIRHGLNGDLGFSAEDRAENIRRIGEVAKLFAEAGAIVLTAFISPYREDRDRIRALMNRDGDFVEIFVSCPLEVCESRDPKGLYARARSGEIPNFTGISDPYEAPEAPELVVKTQAHSVDECVNQVMGYLAERGYISRSGRLRAVSC